MLLHAKYNSPTLAVSRIVAMNDPSIFAFVFCTRHEATVGTLVSLKVHAKPTQSAEGHGRDGKRGWDTTGPAVADMAHAPYRSLCSTGSQRAG